MRGRAQNPKTIIIPCIFVELSPLNHFVAGPCHILKSKKVIVMELKFIGIWQYEEGQCTGTIILLCIFTE